MGNKKTTAEHRAECEKLGHVELLSEYVRTNQKCTYRCLVHNEIHDALPLAIIKGHGLRCCSVASNRAVQAKRQARCAAEYDAKLAKVGRLERVDPYVKASVKTRHRCLEHGEINSITPNNALRGRGLSCCQLASRILNGGWDSVHRALLGTLRFPGSAVIYLFKTPNPEYLKFGISNDEVGRAERGHYGKLVIQPRSYLDRADAVLIEQAFKYGHAVALDDVPKNLANWEGRSELTNYTATEFEGIIQELEENLLKLGRWKFAEEYCDPAEIKRAIKLQGRRNN